MTALAAVMAIFSVVLCNIYDPAWEYHVAWVFLLTPKKRGCEMSDIVDRLRSPAGMQEGESISNVVARFRLDMTAAADEIERLRVTIEHLRSVAGVVSADDVTFGQIKKDARG